MLAFFQSFVNTFSLNDLFNSKQKSDDFRFVYNHIYLIICNKLSSVQHGFLSGRATVIKLIQKIDSLCSNMDNHMQTDVIYMDFCKAFHSVSHHLLLSKLQLYGLEGHLLKWFSSCLYSRAQRVVKSITSSQWASVKSGIPQ